MNEDLFLLEDLFIRLQGSQITHFSFSNDILRLQLVASVATYLLPNSHNLNLVLTGCHQLFFLSYSQKQEQRTPILDVDKIFSRGLLVQGIELRNREENKSPLKEGFILYCSSYLSSVEAGELHFKASGFQLYDQEFGRISYPEFRNASEKIKSTSK